MAKLPVRNSPGNVHRRVKNLAAEPEISTEAAARQPMDRTTEPEEKLGDILVAYARQHTVVPLDLARDQAPIDPAEIE